MNNILQAGPFGPKPTTHFDWETGTLHLTLHHSMRLALCDAPQKNKFTWKEITAIYNQSNFKICALFNFYTNIAVLEEFSNLNQITETIDYLPSGQSKLPEVSRRSYTVKEIALSNEESSMVHKILVRWLKSIAPIDNKGAPSAYDTYRAMYAKPKFLPQRISKPFEHKEDSLFTLVKPR